MADRKESLYPADWLEKGNKDLRRVEVLLADSDTEGAGFHLQQAAEKNLKAYLISRGWKLSRIHDLPNLLNHAVDYDPDFEQFRTICERVTEYYTPERYPFLEEIPPTEDEIRKGLAKIQEMTAKIVREIQ